MFVSENVLQKRKIINLVSKRSCRYSLVWILEGFRRRGFGYLKPGFGYLKVGFGFLKTGFGYLKTQFGYLKLGFGYLEKLVWISETDTLDWI